MRHRDFGKGINKKALRLPFIVSHHIKLKGVNRNSFVVEQEKLSAASMRIGFGSSAGAIRESKKGLIQIRNGGKIVLKGTVGLSQGVSLIVNGCTLTLGDNFRCNYSTTIDGTYENITFGDNVVCGWNVTVRNGDGHKIFENGIPKKGTAPITIGDHVWLCAGSTVLKGVDVGCDSVVAYGSLLTKAGGESNVMYAGFPAKIIRQNITWEE